MKYLVKALVVVATIFTAACATGPEPASLPTWCQKAGLSQGVGQLTYFGRADGAPSAPEALELATMTERPPKVREVRNLKIFLCFDQRSMTTSNFMDNMGAELGRWRSCLGYM